MEESKQLSSKAWLLRGFSGSVEGELNLEKGRLTFIADGFGTLRKPQLRKLEQEAGQPDLAERMDSGEKATVFDVPVEEIKVDFPWYYFSGGMKISIGKTQFRISFGRPPNTKMPVDREDVAEAAGRAVEEFGTALSMRKIGASWRDVLIDNEDAAAVSSP